MHSNTQNTWLGPTPSIDNLPDPLDIDAGTAEREALAAELKGQMKAQEASYERKIEAARHLAGADWPKYVTARDLAGNVFPYWN
jgi:hypothetical protein